MNKYIPHDVKDISESKKRIMRNVLNEIQNGSKRPKHNWRYGIITAVFIVSVVFFVLSEVWSDNESPVAENASTTEIGIDLSKPTFFEEKGSLYVGGITLGESQSKVTEIFGENFTNLQEKGSDFVMDYGGQVKFFFIEEQLNSIVFMNVNKAHFDKLFKDYKGFKFKFFDIDDVHFFYSNNTNQIIQASTQPNNENISLTLSYAESYLQKAAEYLYLTQQNIKSQNTVSTDPNVDLAKPTFTAEEGYLNFHGVKLGDPISKIIECLGGNYVIGQADGSGSDFVINYDGLASFHFYNDKLDSMVLREIDKEHFDELFTHYGGFKFISSSRDTDRFIYSEKTGQSIKATTQSPKKDLYLYIGYPGPDLWDNPEMENIPNPWKHP